MIPKLIREEDNYDSPILASPGKGLYLSFNPWVQYRCNQGMRLRLAGGGNSASDSPLYTKSNEQIM